MGFYEEITQVINKHSMENGSDTPDYILATYLLDCLNSFNKAVNARERFFGRCKINKSTTETIPGLTDN